jgi:hypothetical protein
MSVRLLVLAAAVLLATAPAAHAQGVTNPAQNPAPITITIDGQTYHDGRDTLPGFDDDLCTAIPNVQYDFDDDQIQYYDGGGELVQTAHWTEWDRISGYDTWRKQHQGATPTATPTPAPTSAATTTPAPTSAAAATPAPTSSAGRTPTTKTTSTSSGKSRTTAATTDKSTSTKHAAGSAATTTTTDGASPTGAKHAGSSSAKHSTSGAANDGTADRPAGGGGGGGNGAAPPPASNQPVSGGGTSQTGGGSAPPPTTKLKLASQTLGGPRDTRLAGAGILLALFALGCLGLVFGEFRHQMFGRPHTR